MNTKNKWISSKGPLIIMNYADTEQWLGGNNSSRYHHSHYDMACNIEDDINIIQVNGINVLVLGDEPNQTTYLKRSNNSGLLVRWVWADSEDDLFHEVKSLEEPIVSRTSGFSFVVHDKLCLFPAIDTGEIGRKSGATFSMAKGSYYIITSYENSNPAVNFVAHWILSADK